MQFEPSFTATVIYGEDYPTVDPVTDIVRSDFLALVVPDDKDTPFQMHATGIQFPTAELAAITGSTTTGLAVPYGATYSGRVHLFKTERHERSRINLFRLVWVPRFRGGSSKYANLQNSVFVGSETVSSGANPGEFYVGVKISKVFSTNTSVVIGQEFP